MAEQNYDNNTISGRVTFDVGRFLEEESRQTKSSTTNLRIQLARAENKKQRCYQNQLKDKERAKKAIEKCRESAAAFQVADEEVQKLKTLLEEQIRVQNM
jgi:hypothetical protein